MSFLCSRRLFAVLIVLCLIAGCTKEPAQAELPPIPHIDTERYLPVIQQQIEAAVSQVEKFPAKPVANGTLGKLLFTYEQYEYASVMFDRAALLDSRDFRWSYLSGRAKAELGQTAAAEKSFLSALEQRENYGPINVQLAELYLKVSRDDDARAAVKRVLDAEPDRPEAHFILAKLAAREGKPERTIEHLDRVRQLSGNFGALHYQYSQAYRLLGNPQQADKHLQQYEQFKEVTADVTDPVLSNILELNISVNQLISRAKRLVARGDDAAALELLEQAVANDPESLGAHVTLVGVYASSKRFAEADKHIAAATAIDPDHPKLHYAIGIARMVEQRITEATRAFERTLSIDPRNIDASVQLGMLLEQQDRKREAVIHYKKVLTQAPMHRMANWLSGRLLLADGDAAGAVAHLEKLRDQQDPISPEILIDLASAYAATKRRQDAVTALEESLQLAQRYKNAQAANTAKRMLRSMQVGSSN